MSQHLRGVYRKIRSWVPTMCVLYSKVQTSISSRMRAYFKDHKGGAGAVRQLSKGLKT